MKKTSHRSLPKPTQGYRVFTAIQDTVQAVRNNLWGVAGSLLAAVLLSVAVLLVALLLIGTSILAPGSNIGITDFSIGPGLILSLLALIVVAAVMSALANILLAFSIDDGARNKKTLFSDVFTRSRKVLVRVIVVQALLFAVILAPLFLIGLLSLLGAMTGRADDSTLAFMFLLPLMVLASIVWMVIALLRYGLAPLVAIFEPKVSVKETLARSKKLLTKSGQWFLAKTILLAFLAMLVLSIFAPGQNVPGSQQNDNFFVDLLSFIISVILTGVLLMLYRNQKALKE